MRRPCLVLSVSMLALAALFTARPAAADAADAGAPLPDDDDAVLEHLDAGAPTPKDPNRKPADPDTPSLIPHTLEGRARCVGCHGVAAKHPYPPDHAGRPSAACLACHVPSKSSKASVPNTPTPPKVTNNFCLACHAKQDAKLKLPSGESLSVYIDPQVYAKSMHGRKHMSCAACHPKYQKHPHEPFKGQTTRELNRKVVTERCATCHKPIFEQYRTSVHGKALVEENNLDVPTCTDCHGVHNIRNPETLLFRLDSPDTCSKCHGDAKLMAKYKISPEVTKSYLADFHGSTVRLSRQKGDPSIGSYKAVCYDCHGIHDIKAVKDPSSSVVKENLVKTCERCHQGAGVNFPTAWMGHYTPDKDKWPIVYWVNVFYKLAIPGILGGMGLYIVLELYHEIVVWLRRRRQVG